MNFSEKLPAFANPQGRRRKTADCLYEYFPYSRVPLGISHLDLAGNEKILDIGCGGGINLSRFFKESSPRSRDRHRSFTGLRELFFYAQPQCHCGRTVFRL